MADPVESPSEFRQIPYEYQAQLLDADKKRMIAQMLMQRFGQQPQGQMVSGHYVRPNIMENLAGVLGTAFGMKGMGDAAGAQQNILRTMAGAQQGEVGNMMDMMRPKPQPNPVPNDDMGNQLPTSSIPGNPMGAEMLGLTSRFPQNQAIAKAMQANRSALFGQMAPHATPESIAGAQGDPNRLAPQPLEQFERVPTPSGATPGAYQRSLRSGKVSKIDEAQTINIGSKGIFDTLHAEQARLGDRQYRQPFEQARNTLSTVSEAASILESALDPKTGMMNTGTFAEWKTKFQKLAGLLNMPVPPEAAGTEMYQSLIVPMVGRIVQMFGAGTAISNADLAFAQKAVGDATKDPRMATAALQHLARGALKDIDYYNKQVGNLGDIAWENEQTRSLTPIYRNMAIRPLTVRFPKSWPDDIMTGTDPLAPRILRPSDGGRVIERQW